MRLIIHTIVTVLIIFSEVSYFIDLIELVYASMEYKACEQFVVLTSAYLAA